MRTGKFNGQPDGSQVRELVIADWAIGMPGNRRARLMGASALAGGTVRCLVVAAGIVMIFGTPAAAACRSGTGSITIPGGIGGGGDTTITLPFGVLVTDIIGGTGCNAGATGNNALAIGSQASVFGDEATAYGRLANATGDFATATGGNANANGTNATATGQGSHANGAATTATGSNSTASGTNATATGAGSTATGDFA